MSRPVPIPQTRRRFAASEEGERSSFLGHGAYGHHAHSMPAVLQGPFDYQFHGSFQGEGHHHQYHHEHHLYDHHDAGSHHQDNQLFNDMQHVLHGNEQPLEPPLTNFSQSHDCLAHTPPTQRTGLFSHDGRLGGAGSSSAEAPTSAPEDDDFMTNFNRPIIPPHELVDRANSEEMCRSLSSKKTPFTLRDCLL